MSRRYSDRILRFAEDRMAVLGVNMSQPGKVEVDVRWDDSDGDTHWYVGGGVDYAEASKNLVTILENVGEIMP